MRLPRRHVGLTRGRRGLARAVAVLLLRRVGGLTAGELLDCDDDSEWARFRSLLHENAAAGFPIDAELVQVAQDLLEKHQDAMSMDLQSAYGASAGMQRFFAACNAPPGSEEVTPQSFCLYGAVAALWVVARVGHPQRRALLSHAEFLLGKTMRSTMDFMESSGWPISSLDIVANLQVDDGPFRLPPTLAVEYQLPQPGATGKADGQVDATAHMVVWEIGVHASLSAEPLQMWARFIPRAVFAHRNLIRDQYPQWLPDKCETLYHYARLSCDMVEDDLTDFFRRRLPRSSTSKDPIENIDDFAEEFRSLTGSRLQAVDAFLCTVAYLCLLVEGLGLPVLGYFGHPLLFMVPEIDVAREDFWARFAAMAASPSVGFAVSDPFLQMQFEYQVGAPRLPAIRTHALYTGVTHFPARPNEVLVLDRPHECVLMCVIQRLLTRDEEGPDAKADWSLSDGRLRSASSSGYPYRFITRALTDKRFSTFAQFRAVVLFAYDMDLITFYEFYGMAMPIFMPSHLPKYLFQQDHKNYEGRWRGRRVEDGRPQMWPAAAGSVTPFDEGLLDAVRHTVGFSDYFRFPEVIHFASLPDLLDRLPKTDFFEVVQGMSRYNQESLIASSIAWRSLLRRATGWDAEIL